MLNLNQTHLSNQILQNPLSPFSHNNPLAQYINQIPKHFISPHPHSPRSKTTLADHTLTLTNPIRFLAQTPNIGSPWSPTPLHLFTQTTFNLTRDPTAPRASYPSTDAIFPFSSSLLMRLFFVLNNKVINRVSIS